MLVPKAVEQEVAAPPGHHPQVEEEEVSAPPGHHQVEEAVAPPGHHPQVEVPQLLLHQPAKTNGVQKDVQRNKPRESVKEKAKAG